MNTQRDHRLDPMDRKGGDPSSRREFLKYSVLAGLSLTAPGLLSGCAVDPVTGNKQLMLLSQDQEVAIDKQQSPFQFSSDYGVCQDARVNQYVSQVGNSMLPVVHRKDMPYTFQCVNATYVNAYAFPGGSIGLTRGILLEMDNEAELASLLGHELGHVNARHSAEQASKGQISSLIVGGLSAIASTQGSGLGSLTQQLGALGQGMFLSSYSRSNEREADALGHQYMTGAGYDSKGFVGLMEMLDSMNKSQSNSVQMLFSTHPMSSERLSLAVQRDSQVYPNTHGKKLGKERYMDNIASVRKLGPAIEKMQEGEKYMAKEKYDQAQASLKSAVNLADKDYTAHVLLAKCMLIQKKNKEAAAQAKIAKQLYPQEIQGHYISGLANMGINKPGQAYADFSRCNQILPGNPQVTFYSGYALDKDGQQKPAANQYAAYLKEINYASNKYSQHAYKRLKEWGYVK